MTDVADMASEIEGEHLAAGVAAARQPIAAGSAGECEECGHWMPRLVDGQCGFCRDGRLPPDDWEPPTPPADFIPTRKEMPMPAKTIQLPAYATAEIDAVDAYAAEHDCTMGEAARALIERGMGVEIIGVPEDRPEGPVDLTSIALPALFEEIERRTTTVTGALVERAEAAEAKLAMIREAMA